MIDEQVSEIGRAVSALRAKCTRSRAAGFRAKNFEKLITSLSSSVTPQASECPDYLIVAALYYLGPEKSDPPASVRRRFQEVANRYAVTTAKEVYYLALAWGCGHRFGSADDDQLTHDHPKYGEFKGGTPQRERIEEDTTWNDIWPNAYAAFSRLIEVFVWKAIKWLAGSVTDFVPPEDLAIRSIRQSILEQIVWPDAERLAWHLIYPTVRREISGRVKARIICDQSETRIEWGNGITDSVLPGSKLVFEIAAERGQLRGQGEVSVWRRSLVRGTRIILLAKEGLTRIRFDPKLEQASLGSGERALLQGSPTFYLYQCGCGTGKCSGQHRLSSWRPDVSTLPAFVASAVKGPQIKLQTGSFEQGLYYPLLARDGIEYEGVYKRLRRVSVEYKICPKDSCRDAKGKRNWYEGNKCPRCNGSDDIHLVARQIKEQLIVITLEAPPYEPHLCLKCHNKIKIPSDDNHEGDSTAFRAQECGNLFTQKKCPICGWIPRGLGRIRCTGIVQINKANGTQIKCGTGGRLITHNGAKYVEWEKGFDRIKLEAGDTAKRCRCLHDEPRCPACGLPRQLRPVQVWVRTYAKRATYDPDRDVD